MDSHTVWSASNVQNAAKKCWGSWLGMGWDQKMLPEGDNAGNVSKITHTGA